MDEGCASKETHSAGPYIISLFRAVFMIINPKKSNPRWIL